LTDGTTLAANFDVINNAVFDNKEHFDFIAAQWVVAFAAHSRWFKRTAITRALVMIEDDLAI
jgi:hypothetical protein